MFILKSHCVRSLIGPVLLDYFETIPWVLLCCHEKIRTNDGTYSGITIITETPWEIHLKRVQCSYKEEGLNLFWNIAVRNTSALSVFLFINARSESGIFATVPGTWFTNSRSTRQLPRCHWWMPGWYVGSAHAIPYLPTVDSILVHRFFCYHWLERTLRQVESPLFVVITRLAGSSSESSLGSLRSDILFSLVEPTLSLRMFVSLPGFVVKIMWTPVYLPFTW